MIGTQNRRVQFAFEKIQLYIKNRVAMKRPRGRPPVGAILQNGQYVLPPEAVDAAAQRLLEHRQRSKERMMATRHSLATVKPELFHDNFIRKVNRDLQRTECTLDRFLRQGPSEEGNQGTKEGH